MGIGIDSLPRARLARQLLDIDIDIIPTLIAILAAVGHNSSIPLIGLRFDGYNM